jgi:hypothetical protein
MSAYIEMFSIGRYDDCDYLARAKGYLRYMKTREGSDYIENRPRPVFNAKKDNVETEFVLSAVIKQPLIRTCAYGVMLNPNSQHFDCQSLVRAIFRQYRNETGIELEWFATVHRNTNHSHAHIIVMPTDARDRSIMIRGVDIKLLQYLANQWLQTERDADSRPAS